MLSLQGAGARGVGGAVPEGGVTIQGGLCIPSSQGFTTIHPVIESMETGEVLPILLNIESVRLFSGGTNGPVDKEI